MMKNTTDRITELVIKRLNSELNEAEEKELQDWINQSDSHQFVVKDFLQEETLREGIKNLYRSKEKIWQRLDEQIHDKKVAPIRKIYFSKYAAAAAILIFLLGGAGYFFLNSAREKNLAKVTPKKQPIQNDVQPGKNKAILTLADGSKVVLDNSTPAKLVQQGNTTVLNKDGQLVYNEKAKTPNEIIYNTLSTARGEMYALVLSDGSKVWLNSASSIRFPVAFAGNGREVQITGEAYFEVAHNTAKPFKVEVKGIEMEVLGTHFNVNSYDDESIIKATLLEGALRVRKDDAGIILSPGKQAQVNEDGQISLTKKVDVDEVMAWKNDLFSFKGADIKTVMRQLSRWYDIDVVFEKNTNERFHVEMSRNINISQVFKILETTGGAHFKIEGKKVTVMP